MSDTPQGDGWWIASDGKWYAPELHPDYTPPQPPVVPQPTVPEPVVVPLGDVPGAGGPVATAASPSGGRRARLAAFGVGALLLVGGGAFAVSSLTGGDGGGSDSPEEAVRSMFAAMSEEDVIGMLDSLQPGERDALRDPLQDLASEMRRLQLLDESFALEGVEGIDFRIEGLQLSSEEIGDGVVGVGITGGTMSASGTLSEFPLGDALREIVTEQGLDEGSSGNDTVAMSTNGDHPLVAIEVDGKWYLSLTYTIAEQARVAADAPIPAFGRSGIEPSGADSPEGAVENLIEAGVGLDPRGVIATMDPEEMRALYDYAPLFLDELEEAAADARQHISIEVGDLTFEVTGGGDTRVVTPTGGKATFDIDYEDTVTAGTLTWEGDCITIEADGETEKACGEDLAAAFEDGLDEGLAGGSEAPAPDTSTFDGFDESGVVVHRVDGAWYVSPHRTILELPVALLRGLEPDDVDTFFDAVGDTVGGVVGGVVPGGVGGLDEEFGIDDPFGGDDGVPTTTFEEDPFTTGTTFEDAPFTTDTTAGENPTSPDATLFPDDIGGIDLDAVEACLDAYTSAIETAELQDLDQLARDYQDCLITAGVPEEDVG